MLKIELNDALNHLAADAEALMCVEPIVLGKANPPTEMGVYMFLVNGQIVYVGEAKGTKGLKDRLLYKHVSGDNSHACQRAFIELFPVKKERSEYIRANVYARWLPVPDSMRAAALERLLIWLYQPEWNKK